VGHFSEMFTEYIPPSRSQVERIIREGLVALDTNVLLDLYRYAPMARDELLSALGALGARLWIPHQVALEFHRNRISVIAAREDAYGELLKAVATFERVFDDGLANSIREFANRVALPDSDRDKLIDAIRAGTAHVNKRVSTLRKAHESSHDLVHDDRVLAQLAVLLKGKVGAPLGNGDEREAREEAKRRLNAGIPPGFKDTSKDDPSGDYLLWRQCLLEAKARSRPLLLVTRDNKSGWFLEARGKTIAGAEPTLVREALDFGVDNFVVMATKTFLIQARSFLDTAVSETTLQQVDSPPQSSLVMPGEGEFMAVLRPATVRRLALLAVQDEGALLMLRDRLQGELEALPQDTMAVVTLQQIVNKRNQLEDVDLQLRRLQEFRTRLSGETLVGGNVRLMIPRSSGDLYRGYLSRARAQTGDE
jgi:hypothetical protein